jgi:uncharacterized phage infection (PIP) family protein YhgE
MLLLSTLAFAVSEGAGSGSGSGSGLDRGASDDDADDSADNSTDDSGKVRPVLMAGKAAGNTTLRAARAEWRETVRERVSAFKAARLERRQNMLEAKEAFIESRRNMIKAREDVLGCKGDTSAECDDVRKNAKLQSQETLMAAADQVIAALNAIKAKTEANTGLTDDEKEEAIEDIDEQIAEVQAASDTIAGLTEDSDSKAFLDAAKTIREAWKDARPVVHAHASMLAYGELKAVMDAVERMSARVDDQIAKYEEQGVDVSAVEDLKADFDESVAEAKTHLQKAKDAYTSMTADDVDGKLKTVRDEMKAARDSLKEAHGTLKEIVKQLRTAAQAAKPADDSADNETETPEAD